LLSAAAGPATATAVKSVASVVAPGCSKLLKSSSRAQEQQQGAGAAAAAAGGGLADDPVGADCCGCYIAWQCAH
jgi:hypothetical protein